MAALPPERASMRELIEKSCNKNVEWNKLSDEQRGKIVRYLERGCFAKTIQDCIRDGINRFWSEKRFRERYSAECYRVVSNLDCESSVGSDYLLLNIINGKINPDTVANIDSWELCPEASKAERDEIDTRKNIKVDIKVSRAYKCFKCGGNETTIREYQGRSGDELSNLSIRCVNCDHVWRK